MPGPALRLPLIGLAFRGGPARHWPAHRFGSGIGAPLGGRMIKNNKAPPSLRTAGRQGASLPLRILAPAS